MNNQRFTLDFNRSGSVQVVSFSGFLTTGLAQVLTPAVEKSLEEGVINYLFDFTGVTMLESPAVAVLLTVTEKIVDEHAGELAFCGMNEMASKVLEMVGVFLYAGRFDSRAEALQELND